MKANKMNFNSIKSEIIFIRDQIKNNINYKYITFITHNLIRNVVECRMRIVNIFHITNNRIQCLNSY